MKQLMNIKTILQVVLLLVILSLTGCSKDFLNILPVDTYTNDTYYLSDAALQMATDPLYNRAWFGFNDVSTLGIGSMRANDAYNNYFTAQFTRFQTTALTPEVQKSWSSLYTVISMSNMVIDGVLNRSSSDTTVVSPAAKNRALGEAYLMRATAYFFGVRTWGPMILIEDNQGVVDHPMEPLNTEEDVFTFIIRDLREACKLLPAPVGGDPTGRATAWAAKGMLAKVLLAHSGWNSATGERNADELNECISLCEDVIDHSGARLINYEDLFKYQFNVNDETLFALRWRVSPNAIWGTQNTMNSNLAFSDVSDYTTWNNNMAATIDMIKLYNQEPLNHDSIRRRATFFIPGEYYSYIKAAGGGYTYPITKDGIGWMQVKKGVPGTKADNDGNVDQQNSPLHTPLLRLADVYLIHAEACLGNQAVLTSGRGLESFNAVRDRAGVSEKNSITFQDIIDERRVEFCMEYLNMYDMVSWYRWKPDFMMDFFKNQLRGYDIENGQIRVNADGTISWSAYSVWDDATQKNQPVWDTLEDFAAHNTSYVPTVITPDNIFLPYPESDRLMNHYLSEDPQSYNFGGNE